MSFLRKALTDIVLKGKLKSNFSSKKKFGIKFPGVSKDKIDLKSKKVGGMK